MEDIKWVIPLLLGKGQVKNFQSSHYYNLFQGRINLPSWILASVGKSSDHKRCVKFFRIIYCSKGPLLGKQWIQMYEEDSVNEFRCVVSFKRDCLQFIDQLAFDRHTFIIVQSNRTIVRLQKVRGLLYCPNHANTQYIKNKKKNADVLSKFRITFKSLVQETLTKMGNEDTFNDLGTIQKIIRIKRECIDKLDEEWKTILAQCPNI